MANNSIWGTSENSLRIASSSSSCLWNHSPTSWSPCPPRHICPLFLSMLPRPCLLEPPSPGVQQQFPSLGWAGRSALTLSSPCWTSLPLQSWVRGDWHSRPPRIWLQSLFPNLLPTPASNIFFPLAKMDSLYGKRKEKPLGPECKTTVLKKSSCLSKVCDSFSYHVSWNDFPAVSPFYLLNLLPSPPPVVPALLSRPFHLPSFARGIYVYSEFLQLLIFPFLLTFIIFCFVLYLFLVYLLYQALNSLKG